MNLDPYKKERPQSMRNKYIIMIILLLIPVLFTLGCGEEQLVAQDGDQVSVNYIGTLSDGTQFDSSYDRGETLDFTIGSGEMITGFDNAVKGMKVGDKKTVTLLPDEAYGEWNPDRVIKIDRSEFEEPFTYVVGDMILLQNSSGYQYSFPIVEITDEYVAVDTNPELAGEELTFEIEMMGIKRPK
jgi:FKBP-type peptidyl-prolyl cis-trans isomerase 2